MARSFLVHSNFNLNGKTKSSRRRTMIRPRLHQLEDRTTPTAISWDGGAGTLNWTDAKNWTGDVLPGAGDDVTCDPAGFQTILYSGGATTIQSLNLSDHLSLTAGSISVTGALSMSNGAFVKATGAGVMFSAAGATAANASSFLAASGGKVSLPGLTSYVGNPASFSFEPFIQADGANSEVLLPNLASFKGTSSNTATRVRALNGGLVSMPLVGQYDIGIIEFKAEGTGSKLDLTALTKVTLTTPQTGQLHATKGGNLNAPALAMTERCDIYLDGTGTMPISQMMQVTTGHLRMSGGTYDFNGLTNLNAAGVYASAGAKVTLSKLASYVGNPASFTFDPHFQADGASTQVNLPLLTSFKSTVNQAVRVRAINGGAISIPVLTQFDTGYVEFTADGAGSKLDMPVIAKATITSPGTGAFVATKGGNVNVPALTMTDRFDVFLDGTGTMPISQITQVTTGHLRISGGTYDFNGLTNINAGGVYASAGAKVTLSKLASYVGNPVSFTFDPFLQADGTGTQLNLPMLTSFKGTTNQVVRVRAINSGLVSIPALNQADTGFMEFKAEGAGSKLDMPSLSKVTTVSPAFGYLIATVGGNFNAPAFTMADRTNVYLDGTGTMPISQLAQLTAGHLYISGGTYDFNGLTNLNSGGAYVSAGGKLTLSKLSSYVGNPVSFTFDPFLQADGAGSQLNLPLLSSFKGTLNQTVRVRALNGGLVSCAALTQIDTGFTELKADGASSKLDLPLVSKTTTVQPGFGDIFATNGGNVNAPALTMTDRFDIRLDGLGTMPISQIAQMNASHIYITGGTYDFNGLTNLDSGGAYVSAGAKLTLSKLANYVGNPVSFTFDPYFQSDGANSQLILPALTSMQGTPNQTVRIRAINGGSVSMPVLPSITTGFFEVRADGQQKSVSSTVNLPMLSSISTVHPGIVNMYGVATGTLSIPALTTTTRCDLYLDGTGSTPYTQIQKFNSGHLRISGGTYDFSGLTNLDAGGAYANNGAKVTLSKLVNYVSNPISFTGDPFFQADGAGSQISLPALTAAQGTPNSYLRFRTINGGSITAAVLGQITQGFTEVKSDGTGSVISFPALSTFSANSGNELIAINNGAVNLPLVGSTTVAGVQVAATKGGTISVGNLNLGPASFLDGNSLNGSVSGVGGIRPAGPGFSPGVLTVNGNVSLNVGAHFDFYASNTTPGTFDSLAVTGKVTLAETNLISQFNFTPTLGATIVAIDNDGVDPVVGKFAGMYRNNLVATASGGLYWLVNYTNGTGNDVTFKAHPVGVSFEAGAVQRSMVRTLTVLFTNPVTLGANPFTLSPSAGITTNVSIDGTGKIATLTFTGAPIIGGSLPDGKYTLTVNGSNITVQGTGQPLDADADGVAGGSLPVDFHRLFGDADGNATVNTADFNAFRTAFGGGSTIFDYDGVGGVTTLDFNQFRLRFGSSV